MLDLTVWIDRGRIIRRVPGPRIEGETRIVQETGEWFVCRIAPPESTETKGTNQDRAQKMDTRLLTSKLVDVTGAPVVVHEKDRIEVQTGPGPSYSTIGIWEITSVMKPRNGVGTDLLWVLGVMQKPEW